MTAPVVTPACDFDAAASRDRRSCQRAHGRAQRRSPGVTRTLVTPFGWHSRCASPLHARSPCNEMLPSRGDSKACAMSSSRRSFRSAPPRRPAGPRCHGGASSLLRLGFGATPQRVAAARDERLVRARRCRRRRSRACRRPAGARPASGAAVVLIGRRRHADLRSPFRTACFRAAARPSRRRRRAPTSPSARRCWRVRRTCRSSCPCSVRREVAARKSFRTPRRTRASDSHSLAPGTGLTGSPPPTDARPGGAGNRGFSRASPGLLSRSSFFVFLALPPARHRATPLSARRRRRDTRREAPASGRRSPPMSLRRRSLVGLGLAVAATPWLRAQGAWPTKPVRIVVPFSPGGTTDILARALAPELAKAFGQSFIVENKAGAGGNVGADLVAKSPPDGYTLLMGTVGTQSINPSLYPKMPYDAVKDFAPITLVAGVPNVLVDEPGEGGGGRNHRRALADRLCARPSGQAQHGVERQRHVDPPLGRALQVDDRHLHGPLSVPRLGAGAARPDRRHDGPDVRQPAVGAAADQGAAS